MPGRTGAMATRSSALLGSARTRTLVSWEQVRADAVAAPVPLARSRPADLDAPMTAITHLGAVSLDSDDPAALAAFWRDLLELEVMFESEDFVALKGAGVLITTQRVADHRPPDWPETTVPKQIHLELAVTDLGAAEKRAVELGAVKSQTQPNPDVWRVLRDPSGHPFCITTMIPEA